jgi:hypothetical protein
VNCILPSLEGRLIKETTMQTAFLKVLGVTLIAATTIQVADAGNHARKARAPAIEQFRNSNAQLRDGNAYAGPSDLAAPSYRSSLDEGAMSSGMAGH